MGRGSELKKKHQSLLLIDRKHSMPFGVLLAWSGTLKCIISMLEPEKRSIKN